jgi:hypothetical protein
MPTEKVRRNVPARQGAAHMYERPRIKPSANIEGLPRIAPHFPNGEAIRRWLFTNAKSAIRK